MFDVRAWGIWLVAGGTAVVLAQNPVYLLVLLWVGWLVGESCQHSAAPLQLNLLRLGAIMLLLGMVFHGLSVHVGTHVLFALPASWPWVGGNITLEGLAYGLLNALVLLTMLVWFMSFNRVVRTADLVRMVPKGFRDLGTVLLIGMSYVPELLNHLQSIREAQAIRGHQLRSWRDWQPILLPLLIGGLERAMSLAEAMVARGFGAVRESRLRWQGQLLLLVGITAVLAGWLAWFWVRWLGWLLMAGGVALVVGLVWALGRDVHVTRYEERPLTAADWAISLASLLVIVLLFMLRQPAWHYTPFPNLTLPLLDPVAILILGLLLLPALLNKLHPPAGDMTDSHKGAQNLREVNNRS